MNSKVEFRFHVLKSAIISASEKENILLKLKNKINSESELILVSQSERTQMMNKKMVMEKFYELISKSLTLPVKRRPTKPTLTSKIKRLEDKRSHGFAKKLRKDTGE